MLSLSLGTKNHLLDILGLSEELFNASVYSKVSKFDDLEVEKNYLDSLKLPLNEFTTVLLMVDGYVQGFIACGHTKNQFSKDQYACELGFWIRKDYNNFKTKRMLIEAFYYWAKETGCVAALMGKLEKDKVESYRMKVFK